MTRPKEDEEQPAGKVSATTDRLERLANAASAAAQAKRWQARKNGMTEQAEPAEVRDLTHDEDAKARAEAAMQAMMAKGAGKPRRR
jgi:hypothetical protein